MNAEGAVKLLVATAKARCDEQDPATQEALDAMARANGQDRARMFDWLSRASVAEVVDSIAVAWARVDLKRATGRSRDEWWAVFSGAR